jgi:hypothetical protein
MIPGRLRADASHSSAVESWRVGEPQEAAP